MPARRNLVVLGVLLLPLTSCDLSGSELVRMCEDTLKDRLVSPSSYQRLEAREEKLPVSAEEYRTYMVARARHPSHSKAVAELMIRVAEGEYNEVARGERRPARFRVLLSYDAQNSFGAAIRLASICEYMSYNGQVSHSPLDGELRVDGLSRADSLIERSKLR